MVRAVQKWGGTNVNDKPAVTGRRGRRPGESTTRKAVLDAARARFARDGFTSTTIRQVAADAGVDASLVMQFYRSKDDLFAAVMSITPESLDRLGAVFDEPDEWTGERVVRAFLGVWEGDPRDAEPLMAMLRGSIVNEQARVQLGEFIQSRLLGGAGKGEVSADTALRAGLVLTMLVGVVLGRRVVRTPVLTEADTEEIVRILAPAVHGILVPGGAPEDR